jgi:hypothetical protein
LNLLFHFLKYIFGFRILDLGLANSFWDHVIQISIRLVNFQFVFLNYEKLKSFVETFTP